MEFNKNKMHPELENQIIHGVLRTLGCLVQNVNNMFRMI
jgi:hypothetical protein